jgi:hypothetical protein
MTIDMTNWHGKVVGRNWYIHKDATFYLPEPIFNQLGDFYVDLATTSYKYGIADPFDYTLVKLHIDHGMIMYMSFLKVEGWDTLDEPRLERAITVFPKRSNRGVKPYARIMYYEGDSQPVYHHKWTMVEPGYAGFDYKGSQERSLQWENNPKIVEMMKKDRYFKSKIGYKGAWDKICKEAGI